jgi:hypothetical protein
MLISLLELLLILELPPLLLLLVATASTIDASVRCRILSIAYVCLFIAVRLAIDDPVQLLTCIPNVLALLHIVSYEHVADRSGCAVYTLSVAPLRRRVEQASTTTYTVI